MKRLFLSYILLSKIFMTRLFIFHSDFFMNEVIFLFNNNNQIMNTYSPKVNMYIHYLYLRSWGGGLGGVELQVIECFMG